MLLGIIITFLVIWFLLLLGETIIWSDRFRCFPKITLIRFIRVDGWWFGDVDYRLRVTGNRLSPIKYDIPKYESLQRFIEVCADSLGYTLSQNPRSSFLRKVLPMIRKLSTMTEKEIMQYAEQELPL